MSQTPASRPQSGSPLLAALGGRPISPPPIWLMRQAGRYLPEYRDLRAKAGSFLKLCYDPDLASEVTLQPVRRFDFDAAILFADILIVPHALGQDVGFAEGEGPRLDAVTTRRALDRLSLTATEEKFATICETVTRVRRELSPEKALIGFCGAPWTVATYMIAGRGTPDQAPARSLAYHEPELVADLIDLLVETSIRYLSNQIEAGADVVQLFDSWAGSLPDDQFAKWVIEPTARIVHQLQVKHPGVPVIGFPRGAGPLSVRYIEQTGIDAIGCDTSLPLDTMRDDLAPRAVVQGNLDPLLLLAGGEAMLRRVDQILTHLDGTAHIFNLGHGIVPQTPPEHVAQLVDHIRLTQR